MTTATSTEKDQRTTAGGEKGLQRQSTSQLSTPLGKTAIADSVVAKIAGMAAKEVNGVYRMAVERPERAAR